MGKIRMENYVGHTLNDLESGVTYAVTNKVARADWERVPVVTTEDGVTIYKFIYNSVSGLPEPEDGLICIVSAPVLNYVLEHGNNNDGSIYPKCCAPHNTRRDKNGKPYGCFGFRFNG